MQAGDWLNKKVETAWLFAFYAPMLTRKQQDVLRLYLEEDMSLSEIAGEQAISRQGVHEALQRATQQLRELEQKLHMAKRFTAMRDGLNEALSALDQGNAQGAKRVIMQLKRLDEEEDNGL
jgi:Uncharacterized protein conserved in bacteria